MASQANMKRAKARAEADRGPSISITVEGTVYTFTAADMTALDVRAMREQAGMSYNKLIATALQDMDVDLLAVIMWMSRRLNGERDLSLDEVAAGVQWDADWEFTSEQEPTTDATPGEDGSPEA